MEDLLLHVLLAEATWKLDEGGEPLSPKAGGPYHIEPCNGAEKKGQGSGGQLMLTKVNNQGVKQYTNNHPVVEVLWFES